MTLHARYGKLQTPAWPVFMCLAPSVTDSLSTSRYGEQLTLNQWVLGSSPRWCTKVRVARNCSAFFIAIFQRRFNLVHHRVTRTARARRRSGGQKRPSGAFLERGRVPDGAPEKAATNVAAFLLHHSLWDGLALRASARVRLAGTGR